MSSLFFQSGLRFDLADGETVSVGSSLPASTFVMKFDSMKQCFYLQRIDDFTLPSTIYGDLSATADRVLNTFFSRPGSTGVLLKGEKGSGKTLLAKILSSRMIDNGHPTIIVNESFTGDAFNCFIGSITQPTVIIFDEFEKVYDSDAQEALLTLLDGVHTSRKLFVMTANEMSAIDRHLRSRPGRIYYTFDYTSVSDEFIIQYCNDRLNDKSQIKDICNLSFLVDGLNFDSLQAVVEEMNRYGETVIEVMKFLNVEQSQEPSEYDVEARSLKSPDVNWSFTKRVTWARGGTRNFEFIRYVPGQEHDDERSFYLGHSSIVRIDKDTKKIYMRVDGEVELVLSPAPPQVSHLIHGLSV